MASDHEKDPFIHGTLEGKKPYARLRRECPKRHTVLCVLHILFLVLNIALFIVIKLSAPAQACSASGQKPDNVVYSPADSAVRYQVYQDKYDEGPTPFSGEPRPQLDNAWSKLLRSSMIRLSAEEMRRMNKSSVTMKDGSGYVGYLEAIHMLHCVKRMHQAQYPQMYPKLQAEDAFSTHHWNHCLEVLRKGIMCNADTTINTYYWHEDSTGKMMIKGDRTGPRKCTDWDHLQAWAEDRTIYGGDRERFLENLVSHDHEGGGLGPL
ncbi:hypothetical protein QBC40DRAFT_314971 [Triangularia verruculosa]|uniref:Uncharacterized protein n=1 Tax=Triangularia verruculosa TaxID=2587418 RepID=A0AAN6XAI1_9PEZI|nr:hypothetical protein QBC40DRAFT_314971 [Triangularia verruculosa]